MMECLKLEGECFAEHPTQFDIVVVKAGVECIGRLRDLSASLQDGRLTGVTAI